MEGRVIKVKTELRAYASVRFMGSSAEQAKNLQKHSEHQWSQWRPNLGGLYTAFPPLKDRFLVVVGYIYHWESRVTSLTKFGQWHHLISPEISYSKFKLPQLGICHLAAGMHVQIGRQRVIVFDVDYTAGCHDWCGFTCGGINKL